MTIPEIQQFLDSKPGYKKWGVERLAEYLGVSEAKVAEAKGTAKANKDNYDSYDTKENHGNEHSNRPNTGDTFTAAQDQTLEEYCESIGIDPDKVDRYNDVKYWTDAPGRRRYSIVPKNFEEANIAESVLDAIKDAIIPVKASPITKTAARGENAGLLNPYDAHIDKLSEVGEGFTMKDNIELMISMVRAVLSNMMPFGIKHLYIPIGNDMFNTNSSDSVTKAGTPQELSVHWKRSFQAGIEAIGCMVASGLEVTETVELVPVEGNHDEDKVFYLNEVVKALYAKNDRVITHNESKPLFHSKFGLNLISFGHGKHEKKGIRYLPLRVAEEEPELWGATKFREMFLGDVHHKEEHRFLRKQDLRGYTVNFLRDISFNHSTWDRNNGYHLGLKSLEGHVFSPTKGMFANFRETF